MKPKKRIMPKWNRMEKGFQYSYVNRRLKKRIYRSLWIGQIKSGLAPESYSKSIALLKEKDILLNRKMLANLARNESRIFFQIKKILYT